MATPLKPEKRVVTEGFYGRVHDVVRTVPAGSVTTYGDVGGALGSRRVARQVGFALASLPAGTAVPWHRVVNAKGTISVRGDDVRALEQRARLEREGVQFEVTGKIVDFDARRFEFPPPALDDDDD